MEKTIGVLQTVLPVIVMLGIGMLLRAKKLISREGINTLKFVVVNITLPAVLLSAFATTRYTWMDIVIPLLMFLVCLAGWALGKVAAKVLHLSSRFVPFLTTGFEAGMLGYALYNMLYGSASTADFARIDLGQVLFVFTLYKILLGLDGSKKADVKELMREMVFSPIIVAIAAGVLLGATGLPCAGGHPLGIHRKGCGTALCDYDDPPHGADSDSPGADAVCQPDQCHQRHVHSAASLCAAGVCGRRRPAGLYLLSTVRLHPGCHRRFCRAGSGGSVRRNLRCLQELI